MASIGTGTEESFCYYWVHGAIPNRTEIKRQTDGVTKVSISGHEYCFNIDYRDKRILFCFDGDIPSGGLTKASAIIRVLDNIPLVCNLSTAYKKNSELEENPLYEIKHGMLAEQKTKRFFILLPSGVSVFRRFKTTSLEPCYIILNVYNKEVKLTSSSY